MQNAPTALTVQYRQWLIQNAIPGTQQSHYIRWLHMYLNACAAQTLDPLSPSSLDAWLLNIAIRYPSTYLQNQAGNAVKLYCGLENARQLLNQVSQTAADTHSVPRPAQTRPQGPTEQLAWREIFLRIQSDRHMQQLSPQTRRNYRSWVQRFKNFCDPLPPARLTQAEFKAFVSALVQQNLAKKRIQQAVCALRLLYRRFLHIEPLSWSTCLTQGDRTPEDLNRTVPNKVPHMTHQQIDK